MQQPEQHGRRWQIRCRSASRTDTVLACNESAATRTNRRLLLQAIGTASGTNPLEALLEAAGGCVLARREMPNRAAFGRAEEFQSRDRLLVAKMEIPTRSKLFGDNGSGFSLLKAKQTLIGQDEQPGLKVQPIIKVQLEPSNYLFRSEQGWQNKRTPGIRQSICLIRNDGVQTIPLKFG